MNGSLKNHGSLTHFKDIFMDLQVQTWTLFNRKKHMFLLYEAPLKNCHFNGEKSKLDSAKPIYRNNVNTTWSPIHQINH